ncbi:hypothetical protein [Kozakia baliensis]|uniref:hypothetical protein n=1 Tax=Kozakia baliensis TaxID=153496 RepID=UPI0011BD9D73|nr:hypothetical protein [Kozakia baliensis]
MSSQFSSESSRKKPEQNREPSDALIILVRFLAREAARQCYEHQAAHSLTKITSPSKKKTPP